MKTEVSVCKCGLYSCVLELFMSSFKHLSAWSRSLLGWYKSKTSKSLKYSPKYLSLTCAKPQTSVLFL